MRIERINENQIRCTLSNFDLSVRNLNLCELAYGSEKARNLFREMIQRASNEVGFEAEDIPLMVEAIPLANESVMLIITKIEDPEELDTRFSKFTPSGDADPLNLETLEKLQGADEFLNLLNKVKEAAAGTRTSESESAAPAFSVRLFSFETLDSAIRASRLLAPVYSGANTLYKDNSSGMYILALAPTDHSASEFNKICNMLSEYASPEKAEPSVLAFLEEHCDIIVSADAVQKLSAL